jgi:hypothetical protein
MTPSSPRFFATWVGFACIRPEAGEKVRGIIITGGASDKIKYALYASDSIEFFSYK